MISKDNFVAYFGQHPLQRRILEDALTVLPPFVAGILYTITDIQKWLLGFPWWTNALFVFACGIIPIFVKGWLYSNKIEKYHLLIQLLGQIQTAIDSKINRFAKAIKNKKKAPQTVFKEITQPDSQIQILCIAMAYMVRELVNNQYVKWTLISVKGNILEDFYLSSETSSTNVTIDELNNHASLARHVLSTKVKAVIHDTKIGEDSISFYAPQYCKIRSIVCYPLMVGQSVQLVLCFTSTTPYLFKDRMLYMDLVVQAFSDRIKLEWNLRQLLIQTGILDEKK